MKLVSDEPSLFSFLLCGFFFLWLSTFECADQSNPANQHGSTQHRLSTREAYRWDVLPVHHGGYNRRWSKLWYVHARLKKNAEKVIICFCIFLFCDIVFALPCHSSTMFVIFFLPSVYSILRDGHHHYYSWVSILSINEVAACTIWIVCRAAGEFYLALRQII